MPVGGLAGIRRPLASPVIAVCVLAGSRHLPAAVISDQYRQLQELRETLLALHKTLVDSERAEYEQALGPVPSPGHLLKLLTDDPWFAWLHPLSLLIVAMDEALDEKEPLTPSVTAELVGRTRRLLVASEDGDGFPRSYFDALQRDPDVVFAHARAAEIFRAKRSAGRS
jgi:hypothetical protein